MKKELFDKAVQEYTRSLRSSPPPRPPHTQAVTAMLDLLRAIFPRSSPVKVYQHIDELARREIKQKAGAQSGLSKGQAGKKSSKGR